MDLNTMLLIAFAVVMLFCCVGLGRMFFRRENGGDYRDQSKEASGDVPAAAVAKIGNARRGGCCH